MPRRPRLVLAGQAHHIIQGEYEGEYGDRSNVPVVFQSC